MLTTSQTSKGKVSLRKLEQDSSWCKILLMVTELFVTSAAMLRGVSLRWRLDLAVDLEQVRSAHAGFASHLELEWNPNSPAGTKHMYCHVREVGNSGGSFGKALSFLSIDLFFFIDRTHKCIMFPSVAILTRSAH